MPKISELPDATTVTAANELSVVQSGVTKRVTIAEVAASAPFDTKVNKAGDTFTGTVYISAASPQLWFNETDQAADARMWRVVPSAGQFLLSATADDQSTVQMHAMMVTRSTGVVSFANTGVTGVTVPDPPGFTYAANGIRRGTGSPEGVVTATVGMKWIDTAATNGAIEWVKASGAGNTGWKVVYGDTGWRTVTPVNGWTATLLMLRRVNDRAFFYIHTMSGTAASSPTFYTVPAGFIPATGWNMQSVPKDSSFNAPIRNFYVQASTGSCIASGAPSAEHIYNNGIQGETHGWTPAGAWPTGALPGT